MNRREGGRQIREQPPMRFVPGAEPGDDDARRSRGAQAGRPFFAIV
jgi:hypothetical protein